MTRIEQLRSDFEKQAVLLGLQGGVFAFNNGHYLNEHVEWLWQQFCRSLKG